MRGKTLLGYGFGLLAIYLVVYNGTKSGKLIDSGANGGVKLIKAFQGRS